MSKFIPLYEPFFSGNEKKYVNECMHSSWISSKGPFVDRFETEFSNYTQTSGSCSVSNGTVAIHIALVALGIRPGDEVLVSDLTYVASANPIIQVGAKPIFVDVDPETYQINPNDLENKITNRTRCLIVVHLYGCPAPMKTVETICRKNGIFIIEDCAEALGSKIDQTHVGNFSDLATFSFYGNKTLSTGEGGMVVSNDKKLIEKVRFLSRQAVDPNKEYWHTTVGFNYRMTNICAAIGVAQLENIEQILSRKRHIAKTYEIELRNLPLKVHQEVDNTVHSYWLVTILLENANILQNLRTFLHSREIETRPFFYPLSTLPHLKNTQDLKVSNDLSTRGMCLPSYPGLEERDLMRIINAMKNFNYNRYKN